jgi:hypothetical protein
MRRQLEQFEQLEVEELEVEETDTCTVRLDQPHSELALVPQPDSQIALQPVSSLPGGFKAKSWRWLLLAVCSAMGGIVALAFVWLTSIPAATNCQKISPLSPDIERLSCAQEAAKSGNLPELMAGLHLVEQWTPEHPLYLQAQDWMAEWSQSVLAIAHQKILHEDLKSAIALVNQIPKSSPLYQDAQRASAAWQKQWHQSEGIQKNVQTALQNQRWNEAIDQILALRETDYDYWSVKRANALSQQVVQEKQGRRFLEEAKRLAQTDTPEQLGAAIALVGKIDPQTYVWKDAQPTFNQWSETLLSLGFQHWQQKQLDTAISLAQKVLPNPNLAQEAENLRKLSQSRQLAMATDTHWQPTPLHIWNLMSAVEAARQIKPESRFYPQAQSSLKTWETQLQDVMQLHLAQLTASLGQRQAFELAITQAQQIALNRPRRLQAQTLVAHWKREIERIEDRPYILNAQKLAEPGTIPAFRAAIAAANRIPEGRILRGEAQGLAYGWRRQIEVIEDQPFLNLARLQASQGNLSQAIQTASVINPGRALYYQAEAAIGSWQAEIRQLETARIEAAQKAVKTAQQKAKAEEPEASSTGNDPFSAWEQLNPTGEQTAPAGNKPALDEEPLPPLTPSLPQQSQIKEPSPPPVVMPALPNDPTPLSGNQGAAPPVPSTKAIAPPDPEEIPPATLP